MIPFVYLTLLAALCMVYALFLERVRQGLDYLLKWQSGEHDQSASADAGWQSITVVVPARDEAERISPLIASLKSQAYPADLVQFIIVDDHSSDGTSDIACRETVGDQRFSCLRLSDEKPAGKKNAIAAGVAAASGEIIVTTDADCVHHPGWLRSLTRRFSDGVDLVAGPVMYTAGRSFFARMQALEFMGLMGIGAGLFGVGYPRLCNGANLAYRKDLFARAAAFRRDDPVASGDDEFLMHAIVYRLGGRAEFETASDAVVLTEPTPTARSFFAQRARWASKGLYYEDARFIAFLVLIFCYMILLLLAPLGTAGSAYAVALFLLLYGCKAAQDARVLLRVARLLRAPIRLPELVVAECLHPLYLVSATLLGTCWNVLWKRRRIRTPRLP